MAVTISGTSGVTFPDATTQTTAAGGAPAYGAIGDVFLCFDPTGFVGPTSAVNTNYAGSNLNYYNATTAATVNAGLSGTWRTSGAQNNYGRQLFVRVA